MVEIISEIMILSQILCSYPPLLECWFIERGKNCY